MFSIVTASAPLSNAWNMFMSDPLSYLGGAIMGFGGVGESGMGAYHGKVGFDTFSHKKSIVDKKTWIDIPLRYQPYTKISEKIARLFLQ